MNAAAPTRLSPEDWFSAVRARSADPAAPTPDAQAARRALGAAALSAVELPGRKTESWKYSRTTRLLEDGLVDAAQPGAEPRDVEALVADACRIRFVDGLRVDVPDLPGGVVLGSLVEEPAERARLDAAPSAFVAMNAALADDATVLRVDAGARIEAPIELQFQQNAQGRPCGAQLHVIIEVGANAELTLVERQLGAERIFTNAVLELRLGPGARVHHHRIGLESCEGRWLTALDVRLDRDAHYGVHQAWVGSAFRRNELRLWLDAPGAHVELGGATLTRGAQHLDTQITLEHAAPHCTSQQVVRAIAGETSRTTLNGRIHIHRDAQKTDASLSTKNLLLAPGAEINAKPELEIYADDVACAHGATIGELDPTALFYLRSRGVDESAARRMLAFAFLASVVDAFPNDAVGAAVRAGLEAAFEGADASAVDISADAGSTRA